MSPADCTGPWLPCPPCNTEYLVSLSVGSRRRVIDHARSCLAQRPWSQGRAAGPRQVQVAGAIQPSELVAEPHTTVHGMQLCPSSISGNAMTWPQGSARIGLCFSEEPGHSSWQHK